MSRKEKGRAWLLWLSLALGIAATPFALHAASVMALSGPGGLRLLYPFVQIVRSPLLMIPAAFGNPVSQWFMFLQFPLYGLVLGVLWRDRNFLVGLGVALCLHFAGILIAVILAHFENPFLRFG